jgi:hypothetical protein
LFGICVAVGFLVAIAAPQLIARDSVHPVLVNGKVLLAYSNSVPTSLIFQAENANYTAVVGDITGSCACGGYYFMVSVPAAQSYVVAIYYTRNNNSTDVCQTRLTVPAESGTLNELIRCP